MNYQQFVDKLSSSKNVQNYLLNHLNSYQSYVMQYLQTHRIRNNAEYFFAEVYNCIFKNKRARDILNYQQLNARTAQELVCSEEVPISVDKQLVLDALSITTFGSQKYVSCVNFENIQLIDAKILVKIECSPSFHQLQLIFQRINQLDLVSAILFQRFALRNDDIIWRTHCFEQLLYKFRNNEILALLDYITINEELASKVMALIFGSPINSRFDFQTNKQVLLKIAKVVNINDPIVNCDEQQAIFYADVKKITQLQARKLIQTSFQLAALDIPQFQRDIIESNLQQAFQVYENKIFKAQLLRSIDFSNYGQLRLLQFFEQFDCQGLINSVIGHQEPEFWRAFLVVYKHRRSIADIENFFINCLKNCRAWKNFPAHEFLLQLGDAYDEDQYENLFYLLSQKHGKLALPHILLSQNLNKQLVIQYLLSETRETRLSAAFLLQNEDLLQLYQKHINIKQVKIAILNSVYFCQYIKGCDKEILMQGLQDPDADVRMNAIKASQLFLSQGQYCDCVDLMGLMFPNIISEPMLDEMRIIASCSAARRDFDVFQEYLAGLLYSGNYNVRRVAWQLFDSSRLGIDVLFLDEELGPQNMDQ